MFMENELCINLRIRRLPGGPVVGILPSTHRLQSLISVPGAGIHMPPGKKTKS